MMPRALTDDQVAELRRRYQLWRDNRPSVLSRQFGISPSTLRLYLRGAHKEHRPLYRDQTCFHGLPLDGNCPRCEAHYGAPASLA